MKEVIVKNSIIALITACILWTLCFLFMKIFFALKYEKRIKYYTIKQKKEDIPSLVDRIISTFLHVVKKISEILNKKNAFKKYGRRFDKYLIYYTRENFTGIDYVSCKVVVTLLANVVYFILILFGFISFNILNFIIINGLSYYIFDIIIILLYKSKKKLIEDQLLQAVVIMNSAFKSGKNIYQAVQIIKEELPSPIKDEFDIISKDLDYGLDVNTIFERFYNRIKIEEAKYITSSLSLLDKTGGSIVTVFNMIEKTFYNRLKIRNELFSLTASSKLLSYILCVLPFIFTLCIFLLSPSFFVPLYSSLPGYILDGIMFILYFSYIVLIRRIMKVDEI